MNTRTLPLLTEEDFEELDKLRMLEKDILWEIDFGCHSPKIKKDFVARLAAKRIEIREVYEGRRQQVA